MPATSRKEDGSLDLTVYRYGQNFLGHSNSSNWGYKRIYMEGTVNYDRTFGDHAVTGMLLFNRDQYEDGGKLPYRHQGIAGRTSYTYGGTDLKTLPRVPATDFSLLGQSVGYSRKNPLWNLSKRHFLKSNLEALTD